MRATGPTLAPKARSDGPTLRRALRLFLRSLQQQVTVMSMNLSSKLDELQSDRHFETTVALSEIRTQLQELTKSVESCHNEIGIVKTDMVAIKHELDAVQQVKEEIEELREYVDRLEEQSHRRKALLLRQVRTPHTSIKHEFCLEINYFLNVFYVSFCFYFYLSKYSFCGSQEIQKWTLDVTNDEFANKYSQAVIL